MRLSLLSSPALLLVSLLRCFVYVKGTPLKTRGNTLRKPTHGAVASESAVCSGIGGDILRAGGNAADAIVATVLCVGTVDAHHSGIGGGGFALVRSPKGKYKMIDFRETAPRASNETMFVTQTNSTASTIGGLSVGVPGELRGLESIHKMYGRLPWKRLFQPAIKLAKEGFVIQGQLAGAIASNAAFILNDTEFSSVYAPNGTLLKQGSVAHRPAYAKTLTAVANHGADEFYCKDRWIARASVKAARHSYLQPGIITLEDWEGYKVEIREPASIHYKGLKLTSTVAPSSGTVVLGALNILSGYDLSYTTDPTTGLVVDSNLTAHKLVESFKFAYGQRTVLGDPKFVKNVTKLELEFMEPQMGAKIRAVMPSNSTGPPSLYDPTGFEIKQTPGTSQIVAADESGLVISLTTTVNLYFGSHIMVHETGVILNDEMDDFSSPDSSNAFGYVATPANYIQPGKRPLSSISPVIAEDEHGRFVFANGAAGGSRIITASIQTLRHYLDHNYTAQQAVNAPRVHDQIFPQVTTVEYTSVSQNVTGYNNATVASLASLGHNISWVAPGVSVAAVIGHRDGVFDPAADPRVPNSGHVVIQC
ncbi:gamma-glutamyltransferase 1 [Cantharellus anzutake]|uniref:gamma-glutamyltransferase 1 n=1 Tax=Cantharellus anzutake TaxID=1750568 RepID=UPI0019071A5E|nr:gamma-glutamyltransferase 1 [Cantharellus anzutake]KAF8324687.1 gamma-glutamyltransferase 1 [Cantharellus anzutake]